MEIPTLKTRDFFDRHISSGPKLQQILKERFPQFFITKVEDMIRLSKLPVPPTRTENTHTVIFLTKGYATLKIGSQEVKCEQGACTVTAAGQVFSYDTLEENQGFICSFSSDFLTGKIGSKELLNEFEFLTVWGNPSIEPDAENSAYIEQLLKRLLAEYQLNGLQNIDLIQSYLIATLCELNTCYSALLKHASKTAVALINKFKEALYQHIRTKHSVSDYADLLHVSANHLNKTVKLVTEKTASKWIEETLILEAKVLLFQTSDSIGKVALDLGLNDPSYFSRVFKKNVGMSPAKFRKMIELS